MKDLRGIKNRFSKLCLNDFGNVAVITALLMPLLVAGAGFGAEVALWYRSDIQLQQTADKAAYATAIDLRAGRCEDRRRRHAAQCRLDVPG